MQYPILDSVVISTATTMAATAPLLLTDSAAAHAVEMQLLLLPLIGATFVAGGMVMLNPAAETRRIVIGRSMFAIFFAVVAPQIIGFMHPALAAALVKPFLLLFSGGVTAGVVYVLSKPFTGELYKRAEGVAEREADRLEQAYSPVIPPAPAQTKSESQRIQL